MSKGILQVHPPICDCPGCRISSPVNRGRLAEKRTIPLPPTRIPKKELSSIFSASDGDSDGSSPAHGHRPDVKQEDDVHISIMKRRVHTHWDLNISFRETSCSRDSDLSTIISNLHQSRHLVMPERQSRCEFQRSSVEIGLGPADDLLGKRRGCSPSSGGGDRPTEKKPRTESPKEPSPSPLREEPAPQMTPEEHYRRMMSALSEPGAFEEQQRLYQLASTVGLPSHSDLLRLRQEVAAAAAVRSPGALEPHLPSSSSSSAGAGVGGGAGGGAGQRRKQGLPPHRETAVTGHFSDRDLAHPSLLSPQNAPHIALGPHLRPPFLGVPSALCPAPGYGFLQPAQAEMFARQQEILRKQSLARLEMSAELLRQKELENLHRPRLLAGDPLGLPQEHPALRTHEGPDGHSLPPSSLQEDLQRRRSAMLVLRHSSGPLLALPPHGAPCPGPGPPTPPREQARQRPAARKGAGRPGEAKEAPGPGARTQDSPENNDSKESDSEEAEAPRAEAGGASRTCDGPKDAPGAPSGDSPGHGLGGRAEGKGPLLGAPLPPPLPLSLPYAVSPYFHTGTMGGLFLDGGEEAVGPEDVSKWTVDDVCTFVGGLAGCGEYASVFREQAIDGETLPLLTEEHLLTNMGLKLGPALKIRSHVAKRVGRLFYMASFPVALPLQAPGLRGAADRELPAELQPSSPAHAASPFGGGFSASRGSPKQENGTPSLLVGMGDVPKPPS
ncbi:sterile alpha motif domain-containing protein 11 isoform X2 [Antechinus flavipes]|nr:sterile alpha motif domain-containing protein 11 isoform X2 [Antechinus flavipes]XP_051844838.1 sterile alpha motif domain-containing protein 11 isoform X2 [Antechinus flavipes]